MASIKPEFTWSSGYINARPGYNDFGLMLRILPSNVTFTVEDDLRVYHNLEDLRRFWHDLRGPLRIHISDFEDPTAYLSYYREDQGSLLIGVRRSQKLVTISDELIGFLRAAERKPTNDESRSKIIHRKDYPLGLPQLTPEESSSSFLNRNRDNLVVTILGGLVVGLVTWYLGLE